MQSTLSHPVNQKLLWGLIALKLAYVFFVWHGSRHLAGLDADTWLHLARIQELWLHQDWFNNVIARTNTPYGVTTHWSRMLDMLALPVVWVLHWFMPLQDSLLALPLWWNTGVLLLILLPLQLCITNRTTSSPYATAFLLLSLGLGVFYLSLYSPQQFDYHTLLATLCVALLAVAVALSRTWDSGKLASLLGVVAGIGVWLSVEFLFPVFFCLLWLAFIWLRDGWIWPLQRMSVSLFVVVGLAFLLEQPYESWAVVEHDSLSIVHVCATGMNMLVLWLLSGLNPRLLSRASRLTAAGIAFAGILVVLHICFPQFWRGALVTVSESLSGTYYWRISEMRPLYKNFSPVLLVTAYMGGISLPWYWRQWRQQAAHADFYLLLVVLYSVFALAMFFQTRWISYALPITTLMLTIWINGIAVNGQLRDRGLRWLVLVFAVAPLLAYNIESRLASPNGRQAHTVACDAALEQAIREDYPSSRFHAPQRMIVPTNVGTMALFYTPHSIIASNYHRNTDGIVAQEKFFRAKTEGEAHAIIKERGIEVVMFCRPLAVAQDVQPYLYDLTHGRAPPDWLRPINHQWKETGLFIAVVQAR